MDDRRFVSVGTEAHPFARLSMWPVVEGRVHTSRVEGDKTFGGWIGELTYSYAAAGDYYSGTYQRRFRRQQRAEAFLDRFPMQTLLPVHYSPSRPDVSVVFQQDIGLRLVGF